jgi:hypothetical protein
MLKSWRATLAAGVFVVGVNGLIMFVVPHRSNRPTWIGALDIVGLASIGLIFVRQTWIRYKAQQQRAA